jgi:succinoglycan biosynthesis protein ExoV
MKLFYIKDNFGDALNPIIFNHFLPNFFDNNSEELVLGIGSILGFPMEEARRKIVFSSGFGAGQPSVYGSVPSIDQSFEVVCVRGPLTAKILGLPTETAVTDGAALLRFFDFPTLNKRYQVSFMPHISSEAIYDWETICKKVGFHYISPRQLPMEVIMQIRQSELLIAEAG